MRVWLSSGILLTALLVGVLFAEDEAPPAAPTGPSVACELAYTDVIAFDYDRDGTRDRVQFWLVIEGRPASGEPGTAGAVPASGSVTYYVYDVVRKRRIDDWLMGFNMGFPVAGQPYPIADIRIEGRTARFDVRGATWTVTDGGDTWEKDTIEIESGGRKRKGRFYGGDVRVTPDPNVVWEPLDIEENRECNGCHRDAAVSMAAEGGPHRELECEVCHAEHPPDTEGAFPQCVECHEAHDEDHDREELQTEEARPGARHVAHDPFSSSSSWWITHSRA